MLDLSLSILFSSLIFILFKLFSTYKVETIYAIIINYMVASLCGLIHYSGPIATSELPSRPWFWFTVSLGVLFIFTFNVMAKTSQIIGVSVASVATKMSLIIPVLFGVFMYHEELGVIKIIGILLALSAVYFTSTKEKSVTLDKNTLLLPLLVFLCSGAIDTSIQYVQETHLPQEEFPLFCTTVFGSAAVFGLIFIVIKKNIKINLKNLTAGVLLGIVNYFSIFFLLKALKSDWLNTASVFTINNVAIVLLSTLLGITLFKENMSLKNWGGILLAVISIILVALF